MLAEIFLIEFVRSAVVFDEFEVGAFAFKGFAFDFEIDLTVVLPAFAVPDFDVPGFTVPGFDAPAFCELDVDASDFEDL